MVSPQTFDLSTGPDLTGSWKNYKTGQVIKIKDTLFEDNNLVGVTTAGQMINMNQLKDFVKYDPSKDETSSQTPSTWPSAAPAPQKQMPQATSDVLLRGLKTDDPYLDNSYLGDQYSAIPGDSYMGDGYGLPNNIPTTTTTGKDSNIYASPINDPDQSAIDKVLGDIEGPQIDVKVTWEVPQGVKFLEEYLHIPKDKISKSIIAKFASETDIHNKIKREIEKIIGVLEEKQIKFPKPTDTGRPAGEPKAPSKKSKK